MVSRLSSAQPLFVAEDPVVLAASVGQVEKRERVGSDDGSGSRLDAFGNPTSNFFLGGGVKVALRFV